MGAPEPAVLDYQPPADVVEIVASPTSEEEVTNTEIQLDLEQGTSEEVIIVEGESEEFVGEEADDDSAARLFIISCSDQFLTDNDGELTVCAEQSRNSEWTLGDAGDGTFYLTSAFGMQLSDIEGGIYGSAVGVNAAKAAAQRWDLTSAGGENLYLQNQATGRFLNEVGGKVGSRAEKGKKEKWTIETRSGEVIALDEEDEEYSILEGEQDEDVDQEIVGEEIVAAEVVDEVVVEKTRPISKPERAQIVLSAKMAKMGSYGFGSTWNDRWVVLDRQFLSLYDDKNATTPKTVVPLKSVKSVSSSNRKQFAFKIKTTIAETRTLTGKEELSVVLDAGSAQAQQQWINQITQMLTKKSRRK